MPIPGVKVYSAGIDDTLQTNNDGEVNINIFRENVPIFFSFEPIFKKTKYTKEELKSMHNTIYMEHTNFFAKLNPSKITAKEYSEDLPFFVDIINLDDNSTISTDDEANEAGQVSVSNYEKANTVFRTLESKKVLLVIDGIPLDDEIHRNGKVEVLLNFDKSITQRIQKIYGPSFTTYSTDAIGGIIHYFTIMPPISYDNKLKIIYAGKYSSASNTFINNLNFRYSTEKWASYTSFSYGKFGDIEMGKNRKKLDKQDSLYALRLKYVVASTDTDIIRKNPDPYKQIGTSFDQIYFFQKFRFKISTQKNLFLSFHYTNTSKTGIYGGMTETVGNDFRYAQCYYGPQNKFIVNANYLIDRHRPWYNFVSINSSFTTYNEYRITRKFNNPVKLDQIEKIYIYNFRTDFVKLFNTNRLIYGFSYKYSNLISRAFFTNIRTDSVWNGLTRYPTNGSYAHLFSAYIGYRILNYASFFGDIGFRYTYKYSKANFSTQAPQFDLNFTQKIYNTGAPALGLSTTFIPFGWLQIKTIFSFSEHIPILDEYGKVMFKNFITTIPTNQLLPEKSLSLETGISLTPTDDSKIYGSIFGTYTKDAIILSPTSLNGQDSIHLGKYSYRLATHINIPKALIYGASAGLNIKHFFDFHNNYGFKINASINYVKGYDIINNSPLPDISPIFGFATAKIILYKTTIRLNTIFNGAKPLKDLSSMGEDYIEKASSKGFLAWQTYNIRIAYKIDNKLDLSIAINNIFDEFYRQYATSIASAGRSFVFSIKYVIK
jgi:hemoglobin/transferrin/lactoferrin receptor protein